MVRHDDLMWPTHVRFRSLFVWQQYSMICRWAGKVIYSAGLIDDFLPAASLETEKSSPLSPFLHLPPQFRRHSRIDQLETTKENFSTQVETASQPAQMGESTLTNKIIRLPQVREMVGLGTTAIYDKMKKSDFPKQIKIGRLSGWVESEVQAWINERIRASRQEAENQSPHIQAA